MIINYIKCNVIISLISIIIDNNSNKRDKYSDLAWELRKLWNIKVTEIPIVIGALLTKAWKESRKCCKWEDESKSSKLQHWWDQIEYWEDFQRPEDTCSH